MNVAEMKPVTSRKTSGKASAKAAKGANGHALALVFVKAAEEQADYEEKQKESNRDKLRKVHALDRDSHIEFRRVLEDRIQVLRDMAQALDVSMAQLRAQDSKANSIVTTVSMWQKMSRACEAGFSPDYEHSWQLISSNATAALEAKASPGLADNGDAPTTAAPTAKKKGRKELTVQEKVDKLVKDWPLQSLEQAMLHLQKLINSKTQRGGSGRVKTANQQAAAKPDFKPEPAAV